MRGRPRGLFRQWLSAVPDAHCTVYSVLLEGNMADWEKAAADIADWLDGLGPENQTRGLSAV
jgi:hypothetical protein